MQKRYAFTLLFLFLTTLTFAQRKKKDKNLDLPVAVTQPMSVDSLYLGMKWRNIGPFRGGRSVASVGVPGNPMLYYMGGVGGGVWKTEDTGITWKNITDGQLKTSSVGAIAVAASDPNVIYVGMGEHPDPGRDDLPRRWRFTNPPTRARPGSTLACPPRGTLRRCASTPKILN